MRFGQNLIALLFVAQMLLSTSQYLEQKAKEYPEGYTSVYSEQMQEIEKDIRNSETEEEREYHCKRYQEVLRLNCTK
jgi:hypothetical protein